MRQVAKVPPAMKRTGMTRLMLVTNPQPNPHCEPGVVIVYAYMIDEPDGPSFTAWPFVDADTALDYLREHWGIVESAWAIVPDQLPGCQDDWIGQVRIYRDEDGGKVFHRWQRLVDDQWVEFEGPAGGYGLHIA
jgi:hypothetical protein